MFAKHILSGIAVLLLTLSFIQQHVSGKEFISWENLQLLGAKGVPSKEHTYYFQGTLYMMDDTTSSGTLSETVKRKVKAIAVVEIKGEWDAAKGIATEQMDMTFDGGANVRIASEFKFSKDPWLVKDDNTGVVLDIKIGGDKADVFDFEKLIKGKRAPLSTEAKFTLETAKQFSEKRASQKPGESPGQIAGQWSSNMGDIAFNQNEAGVSGSLRFSNGAVAILRGNMEGSKFTFTWGIEGKELGGGLLVLSADGKQLKGNYSDKAKGTSGDFVLQRKGKIEVRNFQLQPANVTGKWKSNLGSISFKQTGDTVKGDLRFSNGAVAVLNGTVAKNKLRFTWGINGQQLGDGELTISGDKMDGTYTDKAAKSTGKFNLQREK
jgi:hypothetical protein